MELLIVIILFVVTFNYIFVDVFIKINNEIKLFNTLKEHSIKEIHCFNNYWFNITKSIFGIEIYFFQHNNKMQNCNVSIDKLDKKISCDKYFHNSNHACNFVIININRYKNF